MNTESINHLEATLQYLIYGVPLPEETARYNELHRAECETTMQDAKPLLGEAIKDGMKLRYK